MAFALAASPLPSRPGSLPRLRSNRNVVVVPVRCRSQLQPQHRRLVLRLCATTDTKEAEKEEEDALAADESGGVSGGIGDGNGDSGDGGGGGLSWLFNAPVYVLWAGLIGYAFTMAPNQTPYRDQLFVEKLLLLRGDEGFSINPVLVTVWFSMGLLPLIYAMLLIPTGRSAKGGVPVWPFSLVSFFTGVFALLPYFGLWNPPPPRVTKQELSTWPLVVLESKILSFFVAACALGLAAKAALSNSESWSQYFGFFRESRFIHVMSIDFVLLNLLVVFWVFNDITFRRSNNSWLIPVSIIPLVGPALYLLLRPGLPPQMVDE
ncbi:uncharacterized protein LOC9639905 [Selaginella moellendorffii]|nr:uncharacterized protein LOC9639905 [Selaginella moellendorffii]|eukprot:XP_002986148.2 uncharacterized protein LOC9639905 [Selaginella moellendorffii]